MHSITEVKTLAELLATQQKKSHETINQAVFNLNYIGGEELAHPALLISVSLN